MRSTRKTVRRGSWAVLISAAVAVAGPGAPSAGAAYPGQAGKVAFENQATGRSQISVMNPDGTGAMNVSNSAGADTDPVWSPDGSRIAFVRNCAAPCGQGHPNIFVMDANGGNQQNLTPEPAATGTAPCPSSNGGSGVSPTWSPDGRKIAYGSNGEIMVMNADGSGKASLSCTAGTVAAESQPAWAANGQIAYIRNTLSEIWAMNADGSAQHSLTATTAGEQNPDWSPDSTRIVYTRAGQIWTMNANGSTQKAIVSGAGKAGSRPAWSPDGMKIVFESSAFNAPNGPDIFVMNPDGTGVIRLAGSVPAPDLNPNWQPSTTSLPTLSIGDVRVTEGNAGTIAANFVVRLTRPSAQAVTASFSTANGTATAPSDFTQATGTVTFAPEQLTRTVSVSVRGDSLFEVAEKFVVNLTGSTNATILDTQGVGTIANDDSKPSLTIADVSAAEGAAAATKVYAFVVTLSAPSGAKTTVKFASADGTATVAGGDYTAATGTATIAAGARSRAIAITVKGDAVPEPDERFMVSLTAPVNAAIADPQAVGTILNDD